MKLLKTLTNTGKSNAKTIGSCKVKKLHFSYVFLQQNLIKLVTGMEITYNDVGKNTFSEENLSMRTCEQVNI